MTMSDMWRNTYGQEFPGMSPNIQVGQRWRMHPASDWFMRGVAFATVTCVRSGFVYMKSDYEYKFKIRLGKFPLHVYPMGFQP